MRVIYGLPEAGLGSLPEAGADLDPHRPPTITFEASDASLASNRRGVFAIGNFDGVHRGHQVLLQTAVDQAHALSLGGATPPAGAIIFEPHPAEFFKPNETHFRLTPLAMKLRRLQAANLDVVCVLTFDARLAALTAARFIEQVLVAGLGAAHVVVGYDFRFGANRTGDAHVLQQAGAAHGFGVTVVAPQADTATPTAAGAATDALAFSSSAIRADLARGDVAAAAKNLGYSWCVAGTVISGAHIGTGLGFPTANITLDPGVTLGHGIYAVRVATPLGQFDGAAYFGKRPTFDNGRAVLEVFLFDFDGNLYGRDIEIEFVGFVRPDAAFADGAALADQMQRDCDAARALLAAASD